MDHKIYISDPGIYKLGNTFYFYKNKKEVPLNVSQRLSKIVVPPAWKNVWYASSPNCHIQVRGIDSGGKRQYILSEQWVMNSKYEKYNRMKSFIKDLHSFKRKIKLKTPVVLNKDSLIHLLFNLLIDLHIRVGNEIYAEQHETYGLTTLRQKHLKKEDTTFSIQFVGKSNIEHKVIIPPEYNQWFKALVIENSRNKFLFHYRENSKYKTIDSEQLNNYLKRFMGKEYTCKDFRTYSANMLFIKAFLKNCKRVKGKPRKIILNSIDESATQLGHTRSISRKSYISERLLDYCVESFDSACLLSPSELLTKIWSD